MSFEKIGQKGESHEGITDSLRSAIIVRGEEVLLSAEGKMRDYNEINGVYRGIHPNAQILIYGTSRYVELLKEAIMNCHLSKIPTTGLMTKHDCHICQILNQSKRLMILVPKHLPKPTTSCRNLWQVSVMTC